MAEDTSMKHQHSDDDIIIRDKDGTFKILVDGKFIPLSESEQKAHEKDHGPKREPSKQQKPIPSFGASESKEVPKQEHASKEEVAGFKDRMLETQALQAIKRSGITFASKELSDRALKALIPQIKGVRKTFETKESLTKSVADGGVGMSTEEADRLLSSITSQPPSRSPNLDIKKTQQPSSPLKPISQPVAHDIRPPEKIAAVSLPKGEKPEEKSPQPATGVKAPKPALQDVQRRMPSVAIGPIQELSYSLIDWRRLGENPKDRVNKIENKLGVLEQERYADRIAGIQAWHESEVVQLYEKAGLQSLEEGKPLEQLLGEGGPDKLSIHEWKAISDLDGRLRA